MNIFIEATGSITSGYLIKGIQEAGHRAVGSDISEFNHGRVLCEEFALMPKVSDPNLWKKTEEILKKFEVDVVIPSFDETMIDWAEKASHFEQLGTKVIISPLETIETFQDKWTTYGFFKEIGISAPKTSLTAEYELIKPRLGRGGSGIFENDFQTEIDMSGMISQEKISGEEYTVDVLFDKRGKPIYVVPRTRIDVKDGKSTKGIVIEHQKITELIDHISQHARFVGPINFQLFETKSGELVFIEINPRVAGGMALGFAATENWIPLLIDNIILGKEIEAKPINFGMKMIRYYHDLFV